MERLSQPNDRNRKKVTVQLVIESENDNTSQISNVGEWQRNEPLQASSLGLALAESKELLKNIQQTLVGVELNWGMATIREFYPHIPLKPLLSLSFIN